MARWPLPALWAWGAAWLVFRWCMELQYPAAVSLGGATLTGVLCSLAGSTWWRRLLIAIGFPLSLWLSHGAVVPVDVPAWIWLMALGLLLLVYPLNAWRDAPLFPTPQGALAQLATLAPLPASARILDAGCGLGHGLDALRTAYPEARLHGLEWSWPLRWICAWRCPWAVVQRADLWRVDWAAFDMVYLFQRPESMERAVSKARSELRDGAWMVSLEFEATGLHPTACYRAPGGKMVWLYQLPLPT